MEEAFFIREISLFWVWKVVKNNLRSLNVRIICNLGLKKDKKKKLKKCCFKKKANYKKKE